MSFCKNIISGILAIAIIVSLSVPTYAAGIDPDLVIGGMEVIPDFGSWAWSVIKGTTGHIGSLINDDICPGMSETSGVDYRRNFVAQHTQVNGKTGTYYICQNCGKAAGRSLRHCR